MVLTSRKDNAQNDIKIAAGRPNRARRQDEPTRCWPTGRRASGGRWSSRATPPAAGRRRGSGSPMFAKFWAQAVRSVARPPMSTDFDVQTDAGRQQGQDHRPRQQQGHGFLNFLNIGGKVIGPDMQPARCQAGADRPGTYEAEFDAAHGGQLRRPAALRRQGRQAATC